MMRASRRSDRRSAEATMFGTKRKEKSYRPTPQPARSRSESYPAAPESGVAPNPILPPQGAVTGRDEPAAEESIARTPSLRSTASWVVYDLGDTVFQQTMITNYFPVWVVAVMGGADSHISLVNTITMVLMLGVGPWIGAVSDHLPRRVPLLIITVTGCCLLTFFVGGNLWTSLALFLGANLFFQAGVVIYDALLPVVSTPANRGRVGGIASGLSNFGALLGLGLGFLVLRAGGEYETIFKLTAIAFLLLAIPCFLWVKEPPRAVEPVAPLSAARDAMRDLVATARRRPRCDAGPGGHGSARPFLPGSDPVSGRPRLLRRGLQHDRPLPGHLPRRDARIQLGAKGPHALDGSQRRGGWRHLLGLCRRPHWRPRQSHARVDGLVDCAGARCRHRILPAA